MKKRNRFPGLDDALFLMILAIPCLFALAIDIHTGTHKAPMLHAHPPTKDLDRSLAAQASNDAAAPRAALR